MQAGRKPIGAMEKFVLLVATLAGAALALFAWGKQLQADCLPRHGIACAENAVPDQLAFGFLVAAVGLMVIGLAMSLYKVGVNGWLEDLNSNTGEPASKRRK